MQWERSRRWKEFWHKKRQDDDMDNTEDEELLEEGATENIFRDKSKKTNLPRNHSVPQALTACIAATHFEVLGSQLNQVQPNIQPEVRAAGKDLVMLQREREVVIKPTDKTGGVCVMDFADYKEAM